MNELDEVRKIETPAKNESISSGVYEVSQISLKRKKRTAKKFKYSQLTRRSYISFQGTFRRGEEHFLAWNKKEKPCVVSTAILPYDVSLEFKKFFLSVENHDCDGNEWKIATGSIRRLQGCWCFRNDELPVLRVSKITAVLNRYATKSDANDARNSKITDKQMIKDTRVTNCASVCGALSTAFDNILAEASSLLFIRVSPC